MSEEQTGTNFVQLEGELLWPEFKATATGKLFCKFKMAIPFKTNDGTVLKSYVKCAAWESVAEALQAVEQGSWLKVTGRYNERSYDGKCKHCHSAEKKYWTEVVIDNFVTGA
jgi:single-stranded DNA-binding protein